MFYLPEENWEMEEGWRGEAEESNRVFENLD